MTTDDANTWVVTSALVVGGVYIYRRVIQDQGSTGSGLGSLIGVGPPAKGGSFITAWGFTFFVIAIMATANPELGGMFALLVLITDILANGIWIFGNVNSKVSGN